MCVLQCYAVHVLNPSPWRRLPGTDFTGGEFFVKNMKTGEVAAAPLCLVHFMITIYVCLRGKEHVGKWNTYIIHIHVHIYMETSFTSCVCL